LAVALAVVLLSSTQAACDKDRVREAAKAGDRMATLIGSAIDIKRELGPSGQTCQTFKVCITAAEELALTNHLLTANNSVRSFNNFAKTIKEDTPQTRLDLAAAFNKVTEAINKLSNMAIFPIEDEEAKKRLLAIVNSLNVSIQIIDLALRG
jgi:hypothetical protein